VGLSEEPCSEILKPQFFINLVDEQRGEYEEQDCQH
jgi:hypothetical protein